MKLLLTAADASWPLVGLEHYKPPASAPLRLQALHCPPPGAGGSLAAGVAGESWPAGPGLGYGGPGDGNTRRLALAVTGRDFDLLSEHCPEDFKRLVLAGVCCFPDHNHM